ncbi:MAG: dUTP diphosphatase [Acidimicrobiia bacterium]|nr:dUTP diphosphatase [Acidimicrobiia bacterium]
MHALKILLKQLDPDIPLPSHATSGDAGVDLYAREAGTIWPGERKLVPTGVAVAVPSGYVGLIAPRSGLAIKHGISLVNSPGILDSGYRGEIHAVMINQGDEAFEYDRGDRIAQLVVVPFAQQHFEVVEELPESDRGEGGFGSTGS